MASHQDNRESVLHSGSPLRRRRELRDLLMAAADAARRGRRPAPERPGQRGSLPRAIRDRLSSLVRSAD